jgi:hypothetical protein
MTYPLLSGNDRERSLLEGSISRRAGGNPPPFLYPRESACATQIKPQYRQHYVGLFAQI